MSSIEGLNLVDDTESYMGQPRAICFKCGAWKSGAWAGCPRCSFKPSTDVDKARSCILALPLKHRAGGGAPEFTCGRPASELETIYAAYSAGRPYVFSDAEVQDLAAHLAGMRGFDIELWKNPAIIVGALSVILIILAAVEGLWKALLRAIS